mgnify:CR=1 FL=1
MTIRGGDIHVPHGNLFVARKVGTMTRGEGLKTELKNGQNT